MVRSNKIYLIGFMGSGKSTAGKELAGILGWSFIDLDSLVEHHAGKTISKIFEEDGEDHFRKLETDMLRNIDPVSDAVISTGGGTPCHSSNMDFMLENGLTVYLKMKPEDLLTRLEGSPGERPLLKNLDQAGMLAFITLRLEARKKW